MSRFPWEGLPTTTWSSALYSSRQTNRAATYAQVADGPVRWRICSKLCIQIIHGSSTMAESSVRTAYARTGIQHGWLIVLELRFLISFRVYSTCRPLPPPTRHVQRYSAYTKVQGGTTQPCRSDTRGFGSENTGSKLYLGTGHLVAQPSTCEGEQTATPSSNVAASVANRAQGSRMLPLPMIYDCSADQHLIRPTHASDSPSTNSPKLNLRLQAGPTP